MEVAVIDWKSLDSRFMRDELYEHINAPQWVDLTGVEDDPVDDEAWFCRPSCNHPKTAEDFLKEKEKTPISNSKKTATLSEIPPLGDRNKREGTLKKRGINQPLLPLNKDSKNGRIVEDGENQNPNFLTPPSYRAKSLKEAIKSSAEKKHTKDDYVHMENVPKLKSTLSARNLFSGGDLLNKVAEFCNELKRLATRSRDQENSENVNEQNLDKQDMDENFGYDSRDLDDREKERKPFLEMKEGRSEDFPKSNNLKEKQRRKKRNDDAENTPVSLNVKNIKRLEGDSLSQIRTCPPTPQGFSAGHSSTKVTPSKALRSKPMERGILQELKQINMDESKDEPARKSNYGRDVTTKEARALDVFWFLKPCTLSS